MKPVERIGARYDVGPRLWRAGGTRVLEARDGWLGRPVAVALYLGPPGQERESFVRRARIFAAQAGGGLGDLFDVGLDDDRPFAVFEHPPATLADELERGAWPAERVTSLVDQLAGALTTLHDAGLAHGLLHPGAVGLGPSGEPRLLPWPVRAAPPGWGGESAWLAPETLDGSPATPGSDVWSLGALGLSALVGIGPGPIDATNRAALAGAVRQVAGGPVADLLTACLREDPALRPASAEAVRARRLPSVPAAQSDTGLVKGEPTVVEGGAPSVNSGGVGSGATAEETPAGRWTGRTRRRAWAGSLAIAAGVGIVALPHVERAVAGGTDCTGCSGRPGDSTRGPVLAALAPPGMRDGSAVTAAAAGPAQPLDPSAGRTTGDTLDPAALAFLAGLGGGAGSPSGTAGGGHGAAGPSSRTGSAGPSGGPGRSGPGTAGGGGTTTTSGAFGSGWSGGQAADPGYGPSPTGGAGGGADAGGATGPADGGSTTTTTSAGTSPTTSPTTTAPAYQYGGSGGQGSGGGQSQDHAGSGRGSGGSTTTSSTGTSSTTTTSAPTSTTSTTTPSGSKSR